MPNPQLDQFTGGLISKMLPLLILAGLVSLLPKGNRRRSGRAVRNGTTSERKSGWVDNLVLAPWWVSLGLAVLISILLPRVIPVAAPFTPLIFIFFLCLSLISATRSLKTKRMLDSQTSLASIRELPWKRFEDLLGESVSTAGL